MRHDSAPLSVFLQTTLAVTFNRLPPFFWQLLENGGVYLWMGQAYWQTAGVALS
jgi:hypothetical protein